ncbi:MAG: HPr kinase/phosphorylase, partial [Candidatus Kapabacteria bacterium]|nr:HPr kinase/phosphorylase [Candidatus Kapabacteria bacterium]MDW8226065.1 HPr kinase/phosphorylase [Bacteroidota bacterium]
IGLLLVGRSGIGKSEVALDLVARGHRLVADDIVVFTKKREQALIGTSTKITHHLLEIRGLGVLDVRQMFGIRAVRPYKRLDVIVELEEWDQTKPYDRLGLDPRLLPILGVDVETVTLPIFPGKNIAVIAEAIALNHALHSAGIHTAEALTLRIDSALAERQRGQSREYDLRFVSTFRANEE